MKKVYTLGPKGTDSETTLDNWIKRNKEKYEICLVNEFEEAFKQVSLGEYIFMPIGYMNRRSDCEFKGWVDFHFFYGNQLEIVDIFPKKTKEMVLVENIYLDNKILILHSSTYQLYKNSSTLLEVEKLDYKSSKMIVLNSFINKKGKYAIVSREELLKKIGDIDFKWRIIKDFKPSMVWILYKWREEISA